MAAISQYKESHFLEFREERIDLACAFRWTARLGFHEGVANHYSLAVNESGTQFLMNPSLAWIFTLWRDLRALFRILSDQGVRP